jgi:lysozyme
VLEDQLVRHEGEKLHAYQDSLGYWTIGVGRLIDVRKGGGITQSESRYLLGHDIDSKVQDVYQRLPWVAQQADPRQIVLVNMAFNLGIAGLVGFKNTLAHVREGRYDAAAEGMLASKWAAQVKGRAVELAGIMRTGELP